MRADRSHLLAPGDIPVVQIDRGGQVTYHGPGQLVAYVLLNLERRGLTPRKLVQALENAVIDTVADYGVAATARRDAPGVYVGGREARGRRAARQAALLVSRLGRERRDGSRAVSTASIRAVTRGLR